MRVELTLIKLVLDFPIIIVNMNFQIIVSIVAPQKRKVLWECESGQFPVFPCKISKFKNSQRQSLKLWIFTNFNMVLPVEVLVFLF
jgi:hypothetical protein